MIFVPLEKTSADIRTPWMVYLLIATNAAIFFAASVDLSGFIGDYGFTPARETMLTVFTSMFLHGSLLHLAGNMLFLWMFGDNVEDVLGPWLFLVAYLLCGTGAAFAHYTSSPDSTIPAIGASGAVSGVLGMYLMFFPRVRIDLVVAPIFLRWETLAPVGIGLWLLEQLGLALYFQSSGAEDHIGIAFWAHVGGLLAGVALGAYLVFLDVKQRYDRRLVKTRRR